MIPIGDADAYLKRLLTEAADGEDQAAFPQAVRYRALQESAIAIARLRLDLVTEQIEIPYDATTDSYILPDSHEHLIEVLGMRDATGYIRPLRASTNAERIDDGAACWRADTSAEKQPLHFIWSDSAPRVVYIDGYQPLAKLVVHATNFDKMKVDGNTDALPLPYSLFPELIDYALSRMFGREDTGAGDADYHFNRFRVMLTDSTRAFQSFTPIMQHRKEQ